MTERGAKTLIGAFVLGALALLAAGVMLVGSGLLFSRSTSFALYFDASLRGLVVGAPVYFKGVRVGKVTSIQISAGVDGGELRTPVVIELEKDLFLTPERDGQGGYFRSDELSMDGLIRQGLRARLGMQSVITGQLTVDLDMVPDAPFVDPAHLPRFRDLPQIPTMPSPLDAVLAEARQIPVPEIAQEALDVLQSLNRQLDGLDLPALGASLLALSEELRVQTAEFAAVRQQTLATLAQIASLAGHADADLTKAMGQVNAALAGVSALTASSREAMESAAGLLREDSVPMLEFGQTLRTLREAADAVTNLATLLELKPDALIFGRRR